MRGRCSSKLSIVANRTRHFRGSERMFPLTAVTDAPSVADRIRELTSLRDERLLSDEEFEQKRQQLLGEL